MSWDGFNHPISELRMKLYLINFRVLFCKGRLIFVEFLYKVECRIRELNLAPVLIHMIKHILKLFTPMKVSPLFVLIFVSMIKLYKLLDAALLIFLNVFFVLLVREHFSFDV